MTMKLMLGWDWTGAREEAIKAGWRVDNVRHRLIRPDGTVVIVCAGNSAHDAYGMIAGREFDEVIRGPLEVEPDVEKFLPPGLRKAAA